MSVSFILKPNKQIIKNTVTAFRPRIYYFLLDISVGYLMSVLSKYSRIVFGVHLKTCFFNQLLFLQGMGSYINKLFSASFGYFTL